VIILGAIAAMLGIITIFMLAAGLFFMWRMAQAMHEVAFQTSEVAKCLREELEFATSKPPQLMMLPKGLLPPDLMGKGELPTKATTYDGGGNYR